MKNYKRVFLSIPVLIFVFTLSQASAQKSDGVATHNMLVVGEKAVFLYHLPMFQEKGQPPMPHRYQVILEVAFSKKGSNPQADYSMDRQRHTATKIYTINPQPFVLPKLVAPDSLRKFRGTIFRGHLEKGGKTILSNVDVNVNRVVYFQQFIPAAKRPAQLEYLLFGKRGELFLAHLVTAPPDFDQVISVTITGQTFTDEELAKGIKVIIPHTTNSPSARLKENQQVDGEFTSATVAQRIQVKVKREFYFEEGELRVPPNFDTTPEEKKAGFL